MLSGFLAEASLEEQNKLNLLTQAQGTPRDCLINRSVVILVIRSNPRRKICSDTNQEIYNLKKLKSFHPSPNLGS